MEYSIQVIDISLYKWTKLNDLHHVMYNSCCLQLAISMRFFIFCFKIQRVQKTQLFNCNCIYYTNNRHLQYIYGPIEQYTSYYISYRHIKGMTRLIAAYASTDISCSHGILNTSYGHLLYINGQS